VWWMVGRVLAIKAALAATAGVTDRGGAWRGGE